MVLQRDPVNSLENLAMITKNSVRGEKSGVLRRMVVVSQPRGPRRADKDVRYVQPDRVAGTCSSDSFGLWTRRGFYTLVACNSDIGIGIDHTSRHIRA
jgi:hypothetical protein